jgi:hypothetical protein
MYYVMITLQKVQKLKNYIILGNTPAKILSA